jgi:hypothetical protein
MTANTREQVPGRSHPKKLTPEKVVEMRRLRRVGLKLSQIADKFEVSVPLVSRIVRVNPQHWAHVATETEENPPDAA